jgi:hypothetical protein
VRFSVLVVACLLPVLTQLVHAFEEPSVNLGATTFFDGTTLGSGFYLNEYFQYYTADRLNDAHGRSFPIPTGTGVAKPHLASYTGLTQLIYLFEKPEFLGARVGIDALLPLVGLQLSPSDSLLRVNSGVLGDLTIGPEIQFSPIMMRGHPFFMHRVELDWILPTGSYDRAFALNPGGNAVSFNPYWAGTLFLGPRLSTSWRLHYLWNDANKEPNPVLYPGAEKVQAGQAVHVNFATAYALIEHRLDVGLNGYWLKQITNTKINGISAGGTEERVVALGPGATVHFGHNTHFVANLYFETAVENRSSGCRLNLLLAHHF